MRAQRKDPATPFTWNDINHLQGTHAVKFIDDRAGTDDAEAVRTLMLRWLNCQVLPPEPSIYAVPLSGLLTLMAYNGTERVSQRAILAQQKGLVNALNDPDSGLTVVPQRHHIETLRAS
ncbi:hypothetical protein [Aeromicrobium sp. HA]|uniref:hypothetical protein n=1 Tax=Aeromicrobium sp. HA TaxID=3009077 RepID=UPI0022AF2435|nr:hypothetical protein [Aeromicrobium sp. HA]